MASNAYRERLKSVAKDYAKLPHLKRQLNEKLVSSKINSIIYNDKKDFLIIEDSSSNNHVQLLKASNNGAVESWDGSGALEAVPGVTRSNYLNSTEVARFVSESDVKRAFGRKFKDIYKDTNLKVYGIRPGGMYSVGEDNIGRKVWCDVLLWYYDAVSRITVFRDIYGNEICRDLNIGFYPFQMEHKFRYSGLLYDKLKHILSYIYRNVTYTPPASNPEANIGDHLYYAECIFKSKLMYPEYYDEVCIKKIVTVDYLPESVAQSLYFIHP